MRTLPLHVVVEPDTDNGLTKLTAFQVEQIRAVSVDRLGARLGRLDTANCYAIDEILRSTLRL